MKSQSALFSLILSGLLSLKTVHAKPCGNLYYVPYSYDQCAAKINQGYPCEYDGSWCVCGSSFCGAYEAEEAERTTESHGLSTGEVVALVASSVLLCCLVTSLCIVCYRRKTNKAISGVVEMDGDEDEIIGDTVIIEEKEEGYDMTPIGMEDHNGDDEYDTMVEVNITELK